MADGPLDITLRVVAVLDDLGIQYVLGGSLASSLLGEPRATADVDLAVRMAEEDIAPLVRAIESEFYVSEDAVLEAVRRHASFNIVHLESVQKVDLFVLGDGLLDRRQLEGRVRVLVREDPPYELWIGSAEDQILRKLSWYRAGGEVSDRQWRDVVGILSVQRGRLDLETLQAVASDLDLAGLLARALAEAHHE
ncbi:hypothetical protein N9H39_03430 [Gammaproteobacteria bacterium]|nr:hypothetical protein [Gammaproteobacteria bacterium]